MSARHTLKTGSAHGLPRLLGLGLFALLLAAWFVLLRPPFLGGSTRYEIVRGTSMLPHYEPGELIVLRGASSYSVGEVVGYEVPQGQLGAGQILVHRIVGGNGTQGFDMKGDNNKHPDPWHPTYADIVGRQWLAVPQLGSILVFVRQPAFLAAAASAVVVPWIMFGRKGREQTVVVVGAEGDMAPEGG
jgi:signal peptidase I